MDKKITKATFKGFIRKNQDRLYLNEKWNFDGMVDGCVECHRGFRQAQGEPTSWNSAENTLGIEGLWLVGGGGDSFAAYDDGVFAGIEYYNCCGAGILAVKKSA